MEVKEEKILYTIRSARRKDFLIYLIILVLIALPIYLYYAVIKSPWLFLIEIPAITWLIILEVTGYFKQVIYIKETGITQRLGIFNKTLIEINYEDVLRTITKEKFPFGRILGYGNLIIDTSGKEEAEIVMKNIPNPEEIKKIIDRLVDIHGEGKK